MVITFLNVSRSFCVPELVISLTSPPEHVTRCTFHHNMASFSILTSTHIINFNYRQREYIRFIDQSDGSITFKISKRTQMHSTLILPTEGKADGCVDRARIAALTRQRFAEQRNVTRLAIRGQENIASLILADTVASLRIQNLHVYTTVCRSSLGWVHTRCTAQSPHDQSTHRPRLMIVGASEFNH